jgi:hypothetical protein
LIFFHRGEFLSPSGPFADWDNMLRKHSKQSAPIGIIARHDHRVMINGTSTYPSVLFCAIVMLDP